MDSWHGCLFGTIEIFWLNLRRFCYQNRTIFEIIFIILYAIEQVGLIWFTFNTKNLEELALIVSIFAIIVLTTSALHKLVMESRIKLLERDLHEVLYDKLALESNTRYILKRHDEIVEAYNELVSKDLNNPNTKTISKGERK
tara:strand:- start:748 stop:1173 length:426 start_codon:yes stop_codon:yes gene_type:complete